MVTVDENIARNISLTYKGHSAEKLTYVKCDVKNTGNSVIKSQYLRFEFSGASRVLDAFIDPSPPTEYGVSEVDEPELSQHECRYKISHLEKQQQVGFRFVLTEAPDLQPKIIPFNEEGDVEVTASSITRAADDRRPVEQFVYLFVLMLIIPPIFRFLPDSMRPFALASFYIILCIAMLPLLKPLSRTVAALMTALARPQQGAVSIAKLSQESGSALSIVSGSGSAHVMVENEADHSTVSDA